MGAAVGEFAVVLAADDIAPALIEVAIVPAVSASVMDDIAPVSVDPTSGGTRRSSSSEPTRPATSPYWTLPEQRLGVEKRR